MHSLHFVSLHCTHFCHCTLCLLSLFSCAFTLCTTLPLYLTTHLPSLPPHSPLPCTIFLCLASPSFLSPHTPPSPCPYCPPTHTTAPTCLPSSHCLFPLCPTSPARTPHYLPARTTTFPPTTSFHTSTSYTTAPHLSLPTTTSLPSVIYYLWLGDRRHW